MLDKAKYVNHLNQSIFFGQDGIFLTDNNLMGYEWDYDSDYEEVTNLRKTITEKSYTVIILARTKEQGLEKANSLIETFEQDTLMQTAGRIYIGDYYCSCFIKSISPAEWFYTKRYVKFSVTMLTDSPDWIKENTENFFILDPEQADDAAKKYPSKYPYYYINDQTARTIVNPSIVPADFKMRIYGPTTNPLIVIGDNTYQVKASVDAGERIEIDSRARSIILISGTGDITNQIWSAVKDQGYIFEPIPTGVSVLAWNGTFAFDLVIYDVRSMPKWM